MKLFGRAAVSEFLGDNVIYRSLTPIDPRLPSLDDLRAELGIPPGITPRKNTPDYAQVMVKILQTAQECKSSGEKIEGVIFVGDTRLNDSTAFTNICRAGRWPGFAFIGAENDAPRQVEIDKIDGVGAVMAANRWGALTEFQDLLAEQNFPVNKSTAVLLDLDKTTLGARGRNDHVIDLVRVEAATQIVQEVLADKFDPEAFQSNYAYFNQVKYHPFTTDNQDYLVYICLILGAGLFSQHGLSCAIKNEVIDTFEKLLIQVERRKIELKPEIRTIHEEVYHHFRLGDPTPFKAFRRAEYQATAARMGQMETGTPINESLDQEIVITHEVREMMLCWKEQGALRFGLSDKPDEASIPTEELISQGYKPIHQIETDVIGKGIIETNVAGANID